MMQHTLYRYGIQVNASAGTLVSSQGVSDEISDRIVFSNWDDIQNAIFGIVQIIL